MVEVGGRRSSSMSWISTTLGLQRFNRGVRRQMHADEKFQTFIFRQTTSLSPSMTGSSRCANRARNWNVSVVDTGELTMTGGRLRRLREWIGDETFMVTYSDGVGNIDLDALLALHRSHGRLATVTAVQPPARFGNLELAGDQVVEFTEKCRAETWINGDFRFQPSPRYLSAMTAAGAGPPARWRGRGLFAYKHRAFGTRWTRSARDHLSSLYVPGRLPWMDFSQTFESAGKP